MNYQNLSFSEIVGLLNEPDKPSWGSWTIQEVILHSFIWHRPNPKILEIGCNTGFSSIEFATFLSHSSVVWLDPNINSIIYSKEKANQVWLKNVSFIQWDGENLPFGDEEFDMIFCSNTTSFIKNKEKAVQEYFRVLKPQWILAAAPIFYITTPDKKILEDVETAIGVSINISNFEKRKNLFSSKENVIVYENQHSFSYESKESIETYIKDRIQNAKLKNISEDEKNYLSEKLISYYILFNENQKYCNYGIILVIKSYPNKGISTF